MNNAFYIAATGMKAHQANLDSVAANMVNANTTAYKRVNVVFSELVTTTNTDVNVTEMQSQPEAAALSSMMGGVSAVVTGRQFSNGELRKTENPLDIAIQGEGFIEAMLPNGSSVYSRGGSLKIAKDGTLLNAAGYPIKPGVNIPDDAKALNIQPDGKIIAISNQGKSPVDLGQIQLVSFSNVAGLKMVGDNLFQPTESSGEAKTSFGVDDSNGTIVQGALESSNVKVIDEMMTMMLAQRAYEASLKVLQAADEVSAMTNNLRKG